MCFFHLTKIRKSTDEVKTFLFLLVPKGLGGLGGILPIFFHRPNSADSGATRGALEDCVSENIMCLGVFF